MDKQGRIEHLLEQALRQGRWGLFDRLPSERLLAEEYGVNRGTLRAALHTLAGRGILETRWGSGTVVRALPGDARRSSGTLKDCLMAFSLLMPPLIAAGMASFSPSVVLDLERLLPTAGVSLRNGDLKAFIQVQARFFSTLIQAIGNPFLEDAASRLLPDGTALARLLQESDLARHEALFAQLARILSTLRHADAEGASSAVGGYAALLLAMQADKKCQA